VRRGTVPSLIKLRGKRAANNTLAAAFPGNLIQFYPTSKKSERVDGHIRHFERIK